MNDLNKTKKQLISEMEELRQRNAELEELMGNNSGCTDELSDSEIRYRKLIETANDAIFIADAETGILIDANKKAELLLDLPVKDIIGMHQTQLHPKEEAKRYRAIFKKCIEQGEAITESLYVVNRSGNRIPVEISASITDFKGNKIIQGIFRDISDRLRAEEELKIKTMAVESSINPMGIMDLESNIKYVNNAGVKLWGYKNSKEMIGRPLTDFWSGDRVYQTLTNLQEKGHDSGEDIGRRKDGSLFNVLFSANVIKDARKRPIAILGSFVDITERKKIEEALKTSEEKYRLLFSGEQDAILLVDAETHRIVDVNESAVRLYGYSRKEILKLCGPDLSAEPEKSTAAIKEIAEHTHHYIHYHTRLHKKKDGTVFPVEISSGNFKLQDKIIVSALIRDITERKKIEDELRVRQKQLSDSQKVARLGSWEWNIRENKITWSDELYIIFGIKPNEFKATYEAFLYMVHPDSRETVDSAIKESLATKKPYHVEARIIRPDSTEWIMEARAKVICDEAGNPVLMSGTAQDVTERKRSEQKLVSSEQKYRRIFEHSPFGILHFDNNGKCTACNQNFADIISAPIERVLDFNMLKQLKDKQMKAAVRVALRGRIGHYEGKYLSVVGNKLTPLKAEFAPIKDSNGIVTGGIGIFEDITFRMQTQEALKESDTQLRMKATELEESNTALKVLLKQRENDKDELEGNIVANVKHLIMPYIEKLKKNRDVSDDLVYLNILESNLKEIISPFAQKLSSNHSGLTPKEIQVANLTRDGKQDKEISEILSISLDTVKFHRKNIRKKLGLYGQRTNLRSYLLSEFK
jgi:PAS domain S-box-containing protein